MLAISRRRAILELLDSEGSVRTTDLAERLAVTDETIRRDLEKLERDGLLQRTHGGAIKGDFRPRELPFAEREVLNMAAKEEIADLAAGLITPGERIFIDASSTALQMVMRLPAVPLTIITNSLIVLSRLGSSREHKVIATGGRLDVASQSLVGSVARAALKRYRIDKAFCSGNGMDILRGLSESNEQQASLKEALIPRCSAFIFLADHTKLGVSSDYFFCECSAIDILVTDRAARHPSLEELADLGVEILRPRESSHPAS